jgi:Raf kinase inhibitor-like YbhB/YbcL family protein
MGRHLTVFIIALAAVFAACAEEKEMAKRIAWNVEPTSEIPENVPKTKFVDEPKMVQGRNDFGKVGYNGPCPPSGEHRYYFRIYAIDTLLQGDYSRRELLRAIEGHILQYGEIYGLYSRSR